MNEALARRIAKIDLSLYPAWYRARLVKAIQFLGENWVIHPATPKPQPKVTRKEQS